MTNLKSAYLTLSAVMILLVSLSACKKDNIFGKVTPVTPVTPVDTVPAGPNTVANPTYALVWSDEFNGTAVDTTKWGYDLGNLHVNNEEEYYQAENATVANGNLVITAKAQAVGGQLYTSARLTTAGKFTQAYGRIEASIKLPTGQGMWPAFWMLGANINTVSWPTCGELDIMETVNNQALNYGTMHWNVNGHVSYGSTTPVTTKNDYHLYAIEWDRNEIRWYVDGTLYQTGNIANNVNGTDAFHLPFFIILNLAVGGDFPGQTVDQSLLPESMYVDYVRVYKQTN